MDLKQLFKKKGTPAPAKGELLHPRRDWRIALGCTAFLTLCFLSISGVLLWQAGQASTPAQAGTPTTFNVVLLKETLTAYEKKAEQFEALKKTRPTFVDPAR